MANFKADRELWGGVMRRDLRKASRALARGGNPNLVGSGATGQCPLLHLAVVLLPEITGELIVAGANVQALDWRGANALAEVWRLEEAEALIAAGASATKIHSSGRTALHFAMRQDIAELLVNSGASPTLKCGEGLLPWEVVHMLGEYYFTSSFIPEAMHSQMVAASDWLRAQASGENLQAGTVQVGMSDEESTRKAQEGRF